MAVLSFGGDYGGSEVAMLTLGGDYGGSEVAILSLGGDYILRLARCGNS